MFSRARLKFRVGGGRNLFHHRNSRPAQTLRVFPTRELRGGRQLPTVLCEPKVFLVSWSKDLFLLQCKIGWDKVSRISFFSNGWLCQRLQLLSRLRLRVDSLSDFPQLQSERKRSEINYSASPLKPSSSTCWSCRFFLSSRFMFICVSTYKYVCFPFQFIRVSAFFKFAVCVHDASWFVVWKRLPT